MRGYAAFSGREGAFGWAKERPDGLYEVMFSGLEPGKSYCLPDGETLMSNTQGCWQGTREKVPRYLSIGGRAVLCDEERLTWEEAALMISLRKKRTEKPVLQEVIPQPEKSEAVYRTRLNGEAVDALPQVLWPGGCEELRVCMERERPVHILPYPWRFVIVPGTKGQCAAGCLTENGRITKTAAAVRAKGGLLQPKGLQGYGYVRTDAGEAYWMLITDFAKAEGGYAR